MKLQAKKSLGQHFLNSRRVLEQIIETAQIKKDENILEIGPGEGVLTEAMLQNGARVIAVEKDRRACALLKEKFSDQIATEQLKLIEGDVLEIQLSKALDPSLKNGDYAIVANIPYYITGAILEKFLEHEPRPTRMIILVQREVAERIVARADTADKHGKESVLSISVKVFGSPRIIVKVPRGAFTPPPTVDSAILSVTDISDKNFTKNALEIVKFFRILRAGFAHRRKFLTSNLRELASEEKISDIWARFDIPGKIRAEELTVEQWLNIAKAI